MSNLNIIITGLTRTYEQTYENLFNRVVIPNKNNFKNINIYLCFWDKTHKRNDRAGSIDIEDVNVKKVIDIYKPKKYLILNYDKYLDYFDEKAEDIYLKLISHKKPKNKSDIQLKNFVKNAVISQTFTWYKSLSILDSNENDIYLKSRFDILYGKDVNINKKIKKDEVIFPDNQRYKVYYGVDDITFYSKNIFIEKLFNLYNIVIDNKLKSKLDVEKGYALYPEWIINDMFFFKKKFTSIPSKDLIYTLIK